MRLTCCTIDHIYIYGLFKSIQYSIASANSFLKLGGQGNKLEVTFSEGDFACLNNQSTALFKNGMSSPC